MAEGGDDDAEKTEPVLTGQPVALIADESAPPELKEPVVENAKTTAKTSGVNEAENKKIRELFDMFDTAPKDGVLDKLEFKVAMKHLSQEFMTGAAATPTEAQLEAAFKVADTDHSGGVDISEFKVAYVQMQKYHNDPNGVTAKANQMDKVLNVLLTSVPASSLIQSAVSNINENITVKPSTASDESKQLLPQGAEPDIAIDQEDADKVKSMMNTVICGAITMLLLLILISCGPVAIYWWGVSTGEDCNEPLMKWLIGMAIAGTLQVIPMCMVFTMLATSICAAWNGNVASMETFKEDAAARTGSANGCLGCFQFIWFIYGAVLFSNVGAWSDDSNNCTQNAPTLFGIMYWYYSISIFVPLIFCGFCICIACFLVILGGGGTNAAMRQ